LFVIQYSFCVQHLFNDSVNQEHSQEFVNIEILIRITTPEAGDFRLTD